MYDPNSASDRQRMFAEYDYINQTDTDFMRPKYIDDGEEFDEVENNELVLKSEATGVLNAAMSITVMSQHDYEYAGNQRKEIKSVLKNINDYWDPKVNQAYQMHKTLVASKKEMTAPLDRADQIIDTKMGNYRREVERLRIVAERERLRVEAEARKAAEEAQRLLDEASQKDELDDDDVAILQMAQADLHNAELLTDVAPVVPESAKMQGITVVKTWKARITDESIVPVAIMGAVIRPVDLSALNKLAAFSGGKVICPGVEFYQEESTRVRL